jgi:hypothetical protein
MTELPRFPHCDQRILHAPGECEFCDEREDWQALRKAWGIAFTGHTPAINGDRCGKRIRDGFNKGKICMQPAGHGEDIPCAASEPWETLPCPADQAMALHLRGDVNAWPGNRASGNV